MAVSNKGTVTGKGTVNSSIQIIYGARDIHTIILNTLCRFSPKQWDQVS